MLHFNEHRRQPQYFRPLYYTHNEGVSYLSHAPLSATSAFFAIQCVTVTLVSVQIKMCYDSLYICATFQLFSVEVADIFLRFYVGSYTLGCLKCYVFKININVSTCIAHAYCLLNDHRFRTLNSPSICAEKKDNDIIDNIVFVMGAFFIVLIS